MPQYLHVDAIQPSLPLLDVGFLGEAVLEQHVATIGRQHPAHLAQRRLDIIDGTEGERGHHGVESAILEREAFAGADLEFNRDGRHAHALTCQLLHSWIGLNTDDARDLFRVIGHVEAASEADLQEPSPRRSKTFLPQLLVLRGFHHHVEELGKDLAFVETHRHLRIHTRLMSFV